MLPGLMIFVPNPDRMRQSQPDGFGKGSSGFDVEWDLMSFEAKNVLEVLNGHFSGVFELISEQTEGFLLASSVRLASSDRKSTRLNSSHSCASRMPSASRKIHNTYTTQA